MRIAAAIALVFALSGRAQQPAPPRTLDQVLSSVNENVHSYLTTGPDIFADEHAVYHFNTDAQANTAANARGLGRQPAPGKNQLVTDSILRLQHVLHPDDTMELVEDRDIKSSSGSTDSVIKADTTVAGLFSLGLLDLSLDLNRCYDYRLETDQRFHGEVVLLIDYSLKSNLPADFKCPITEEVSGSAFIDPESMQVLRVEQRLPKHELVHGTIGLWSWSIDYGPVDLNGKRFWLPQTISSESSGYDFTLGHIKWSYLANCRNYHLLSVHSTILPASRQE